METSEQIKFLLSIGLITKVDVNFQLSHIRKGFNPRFNPLRFYNSCRVYITDGCDFYEVRKGTVISDYPNFAYFYKA